MRIVQVVPHVHQEASGPTYSVTSLSRALARRGHDVYLHALEPSVSIDECTTIFHPARKVARKLGFSPSMRRALKREMYEADVIHSHGLWMMPNIYPEVVSRGGSALLVKSPRGTLDPAALGISRFRKKAFWHLAQKRALTRDHLIHATSQPEANHIRQAGVTAPVAVIPNGVDIPQTSDRMLDPRPYRTLMALGRIHPHKNLETLLEAWERIEPRHRDWRLRIVGPPSDRRYAARIRSMAERLERVDVVGPVFGAEKSREYWSADLFVLPTHSENFGMVVAEALAHEVPVIATKGAPWSGLVEQRCGWWIDHGVDSLSDTLNQALDLPGSTLSSMGERGRTWMERDFSWASIAEQMEAAYFWAAGIGPQPSFASLADDVLKR